MLVLARKKNERVLLRLGDVVVTVTLVEIRGDKARIGFTAPEAVAIHREEVYEQIYGKEVKP